MKTKEFRTIENLFFHGESATIGFPNDWGVSVWKTSHSIVDEYCLYILYKGKRTDKNPINAPIDKLRGYIPELTSEEVTEYMVKLQRILTKSEIEQYSKQVLNAIEFVCKEGNMSVYSFILKNYEKGYKPAKDFVKQIVEKIESGEIKSNIDLINHITNKELTTEIIPYTYTKYKK